jgi:fatty-acyl-CoA synthase
VADAISAFDGIKQATVYGVAIPNCDGRAGMAALVVDGELNLHTFRNHLERQLPRFARPVFLRIRNAMDLTSTFKYAKNSLLRDGYDPAATTDSMYFYDFERQEFADLSAEHFERIQTGRIRF